MGEDISHLFPSERGFPVRFEFDKLGNQQIVFVDVRRGSLAVAIEGGIIGRKGGQEQERFSFVIPWRQAMELANALTQAYQVARMNALDSQVGKDS